MRFNRSRTLFAAALAGLTSTVAFAQQQPPTYVRDICVKLQDGKSRDYEAYLGDIPVKLAQVRVQDGRMLWWGAERAVVPAGASARCDYHIVSSYAGFPPEAPTAEQTAADYERAGISISPAEAVRRRDADSRLINVDIWRMAGRVGDPVKEGSYVRRNFYKVKPGHTMADWVKLETTGWMQFAEALAKESPGTGWAALGLVMPGGERLPYEGMTVDVFPDWKTLGGGMPLDALWSKVRPGLSSADYLTLIDNTVERHSIEVYRMVHLVRNDGNQASRTIKK